MVSAVLVHVAVTAAATVAGVAPTLLHISYGPVVFSVIPDFTFIPTEPGGTLLGGAALATMHVTTAAFAVAVLTGRLPVDL